METEFENSPELAGADESLPEPPEVAGDLPSALERLGPSPFPKSGFPFLGFLATVYDHVASHVGGATEKQD